MKAFHSIALALVATAALSVSCLPNDEYLYSETGMCTRIARDKLLTDKGLTYYIVDNNSGSMIPDSVTRVMISCDVMSKLEGRSDEYNIRLLDFMAAFTTDPLVAGTDEAEAAGHDGVSVTQAWVSGGYLNGYVTLALPNPANEDHDINLVFDDVRSNTDTLFFEMRHNAHGECPENEDYALPLFRFAGTYVSYPLEGLLPTGGKKPVVHLEWDWYDNDGSLILRTKSTHSGNVIVD